MPPKSKKPAKSDKQTKPAKGVKFDKPKKSDKTQAKANNLDEVSGAGENPIPDEAVLKSENEIAEAVATDGGDGSKKKGKAGKGAKGGRESKVEKPEKTGGKSGKGDKGGKLAKDVKNMKTDKAGRVSKAGRASESVKDKKVVTNVESSPPEELAAVEAIAEPGTMETTVDNPAWTKAEQFENDNLCDDEGEFEEEHTEFELDFIPAIEEDELEEEASKHDSIDDRYPIESNESEEEDKFETVVTYLEDRTVKLVERDFFDTIGRIPDLDEISIDTSINRFIRKMEGAVIIDEDEMGEEEQVIEDEREMTQSHSEETKIPIEDPFSSEISLEYDFESSEEEEEVIATEKKVSEENLFEKLLKLEEKPIIEVFIDYNLMEREAEERQVIEDTKAFLDELIVCVVKVAEYVDPKEILRESLNKVKLYRALYNNLCELTAEKKVNFFVVRKVVEKYRRQNNLRPIEPDSIETYDENEQKYNESLDALNCLLGRQQSTAEVVLNKVMEMEEKERLAQNELETVVAEQKSLIQKTFAKFGSDNLNMFVDRRIKEMSSLRKEISETRAVLIQRQHIVARLKEKMAALEYIGPNLYLREYETLQSEVYTLCKKLEEKNQNLDRYRNYFNGNINMLAHIREKETMIDYLIDAQRNILKGFESEKGGLREIVLSLKTSHIRVKKQIREMSNQCGLIDKPALCIDYDETLERCITLREDVKNMREDIKRMEKKLKHYIKCEFERHHSIVSRNG